MSRPEDAAVGSGEYGTLERTADATVLRYRRRLAQPPSTVWRALTEDAHLAAWFPTTIEGTRVAGAPLHFSFRGSEGEPFDGEMLAFEPPSLMELRWADDILRFELEADGAGCVLHLTVTFPEPARRRATGPGGTCAWSSWPTSVPAPSRPGTPPDRWRVVHRGYVERFGPEASVLGPPEEWERVHGEDAAE